MRDILQRPSDAADELPVRACRLRPDLLPQAFIDELSTLQERVTPVTDAEIVAAMERELGVRWEDVFDSIDPRPLAASTDGLNPQRMFYEVEKIRHQLGRLTTALETDAGAKASAQPTRDNELSHQR